MEEAFKRISAAKPEVHGKKLIRALKHSGGKVELALHFLENVTGTCGKEQEYEEIKASHPEIETIIEQILDSGLVIPPKCILGLVKKMNGNVEKIIEAI